MLVKFLKNKHGHRKGVVVSTGRGLVGFSLCQKGDVFNKDLAFKIAVGRSENPRSLIYESSIPISIKDEVFSMIERSFRYYKENN